MPRVGRKTQNFERDIANAVAQEMAEKEAMEERERQRRHFQTTSGAYHDEKNLTQNTIGRKVMRTQDGALVAAESRDEQLIVETGMYRRTAKATDSELRARIPQGDYT